MQTLCTYFIFHTRSIVVGDPIVIIKCIGHFALVVPSDACVQLIGEVANVRIVGESFDAHRSITNGWRVEPVVVRIYQPDAERGS